MPRLVFLGALLCLAPLLSSCSSAGCTEIGCLSTLAVEYSERLVPGTYSMRFVEDGDERTCEYVLDAELQGSGCEELSDVIFYAEGLDFWSTPMNLEVEINREGQSVAADTFEPEYETQFPNGEGCPPGCDYGYEALTVSL